MEWIRLSDAPYEVSQDGRIRNLKGLEIKPRVTHKGCIEYRVTVDGKKTAYSQARIKYACDCGHIKNIDARDKWNSIDKQQVLDLYNAGNNSEQIGELVGYSASHVLTVLRALGITPNANNLQKKSNDALEAFKQYIAEHWSNYEYVDGFKGSSHGGKVTLRCKTCGTLVQRTRQAIRYSQGRDIWCPKCVEETKAQRKAQQEQERAEKAEQRLNKTCPTCGKHFKGTAKYCSEQCHPSYKEHTFTYDHEHITCQRCGVVFAKETNMGRAKKYCDECVKAIKKEKRREFRRTHKQTAETLNARGRHVTRRTGAAYEPINPDKVFERDNYVCHICGKPTTQRNGEMNDYYPTVDHVVPLSKGGDHTYANVRTAHFLCNSIKGAN